MRRARALLDRGNRSHEITKAFQNNLDFVFSRFRGDTRAVDGASRSLRLFCGSPTQNMQAALGLLFTAPTA
jgi:hypothetical protein